MSPLDGFFALSLYACCIFRYRLFIACLKLKKKKKILTKSNIILKRQFIHSVSSQQFDTQIFDRIVKKRKGFSTKQDLVKTNAISLLFVNLALDSEWFTISFYFFVSVSTFSVSKNNQIFWRPAFADFILSGIFGKIYLDC